jgi:hypothetical protein
MGLSMSISATVLQRLAGEVAAERQRSVFSSSVGCRDVSIAPSLRAIKADDARRRHLGMQRGGDRSGCGTSKPGVGWGRFPQDYASRP